MMKTEVTFQTEGGSFSGTVDERGVFHDALEHLLPDHLRVGRRITIRTPGGDPVYPDMFVGETVAHFRTTTFTVRSEPLRGQPGAWRNLGFDHIALAVTDRQDARRFFAEVLGMQVISDYSHQTVLTNGISAIFLFDMNTAPFNPCIPTCIPHICHVLAYLA